MKRILIVLAAVMMLSSCDAIYKVKAASNQVNYKSISGRTGNLVLHTYAGNVVLEGVHIDYIGIENDDLFYTYKEKEYYYSGPCSFSW